ncbi:MAG: hypothetical protein AAFY71_21195 [Bacteroidota bacterium]
MRSIILTFLILLLTLTATQAQSADELSAQLTQEFESKYGITLSSYQRQQITSNYKGAIARLNNIAGMKATNPVGYEQKRQKIVADVEVVNHRFLTPAQNRQINSGQTTIDWPGTNTSPSQGTGDVKTGKDFEIEEVEVGTEEGGGDSYEDDSWEEEGSEDTYEEGGDDSWEDDSFAGDTPAGQNDDILDKAVDKLLAPKDSTAADSSKGKKVLKKGLKFLYDELLRPALDKSLDDKKSDAKKEDDM